MALGIFLSYRRAEAGPYARLLKLQLSERFPDSHVFMDMDSIEAGVDFAEAIRDAVDSSAVFVALIGREWATVTDERGADGSTTRMTMFASRSRQRFSVVCGSFRCCLTALRPHSRGSCRMNSRSSRDSTLSS